MLRIRCFLTVCKFQRSAGVLADRWCAHGWQDGGGLIVYGTGRGTGTATLTDTNVYENQAGKQACYSPSLMH